jgi:hypothetical protein
VKRPRTCDDCYFRRNDLCALLTSRPCPTFRDVRGERMVPKQQAALIPLSENAELPEHERVLVTA